MNKILSIFLLALVATPALATQTDGDNHTQLSLSSSPRTKSSKGYGHMGRANDTFNVGQIYFGGHIGASIPMSIGRDDDEISFRDVANTGFAIHGDATYMLNQQVALGGEIGFMNFGYNSGGDGTWNDLSKCGVLEATFRTLDFLVTGRVFFTRNSFRPFIGIVAGGAVLFNSLDFTPDTKYQGSLTSTTYETTNLSVAYGPMAGIYFKAGKRTLISLQARLTFVPTLDDSVIRTVNPDTYVETYTYQNTHGNQHNLMISLGLHVGKNKNNKH